MKKKEKEKKMVKRKSEVEKGYKEHRGWSGVGARWRILRLTCPGWCCADVAKMTKGLQQQCQQHRQKIKKKGWKAGVKK